ncbi:MAG TPA: GntR family transcriptional regulator [Holophagaceae bacterium]|nr:GntR family transcriptional regulator [Holophagaceae bacterium]
MAHAPSQQTLIPGIANAIREMIVLGKLRPGEVIHQTELAKELGVSPVPLRESLRRLEAEGLVTFLPYRGTIVSPISPTEIREIYTLGLALADIMLPVAMPRLRPADFEALRELALRMDGGTTTLEDHLGFYMTILRPAGMPLALDMLRSVLTRGARIFAQAQANRLDLQAVRPTRLDLVEALATGDLNHAQAVFHDYHRIREQGLLRMVADRA